MCSTLELMIHTSADDATHSNDPWRVLFFFFSWKTIERAQLLKDSEWKNQFCPHQHKMFCKDVEGVFSNDRWRESAVACIVVKYSLKLKLQIQQTLYLNSSPTYCHTRKKVFDFWLIKQENCVFNHVCFICSTLTPTFSGYLQTLLFNLLLIKSHISQMSQESSPEDKLFSALAFCSFVSIKCDDTLPTGQFPLTCQPSVIIGQRRLVIILTTLRSHSAQTRDLWPRLPAPLGRPRAHRRREPRRGAAPGRPPDTDCRTGWSGRAPTAHGTNQQHISLLKVNEKCPSFSFCLTVQMDQYVKPCKVKNTKPMVEKVLRYLLKLYIKTCSSKSNTQSIRRTQAVKCTL